MSTSCTTMHVEVASNVRVSRPAADTQTKSRPGASTRHTSWFMRSTSW